MGRMTKKKLAQIRSEIAALEHGGRLTPRAVVDAARDPKSALHDQFEWDDTVAAEKWRLDQARDIITSVKITVTVDKRTLSVVRYTRDPKQVGTNEQGYVSLDSIKRRPADVAALLEYELTRLDAILDRVRDLITALGAKPAQVKKLERTEASVKQLRSAIRS